MHRASSAPAPGLVVGIQLLIVALVALPVFVFSWTGDTLAPLVLLGFWAALLARTLHGDGRDDRAERDPRLASLVTFALLLAAGGVLRAGCDGDSFRLPADVVARLAAARPGAVSAITTDAASGSVQLAHGLSGGLAVTVLAFATVLYALPRAGDTRRALWRLALLVPVVLAPLAIIVLGDDDALLVWAYLHPQLALGAFFVPALVAFVTATARAT
jgi:hypothetical protein